MTYRELKLALESLSDEQLDCDISVTDFKDDYFEVSEFYCEAETDILNGGHPVLRLRY